MEHIGSCFDVYVFLKLSLLILFTEEDDKCYLFCRFFTFKKDSSVTIFFFTFAVEITNHRIYRLEAKIQHCALLNCFQPSLELFSFTFFFFWSTLLFEAFLLLLNY